MPRLFFALLPSPRSRDALHMLATDLALSTGAQAVPAPDLHLTLAFLGHAPAQTALQVLAGLAPTRQPTLDLGAVDYWPGARLLCATAAPEQVDGIAALATGLTSALRGIGLPPDDKPFRPHVTLARRPVPERLTRQWPQAISPVLRVDFDTLALLDSRAGVPAGEPRYAALCARTLPAANGLPEPTAT